MKFYLVDRIEALEPGKSIKTVKNLSMAEEYLADHFPTFPVMPGVMMLEACVQSAAWLVRVTNNWSTSMIVLRRARNIRYANFVAPGQALRISLVLDKIEGDIASFTCEGTVDAGKALTARIDLRCFNLADEDASLAWADRKIIEQMTQRFKLCGGEQLLAARTRAT